MTSTIMDFASDLELPQSVRESLPLPRTNEELKVFAQTLPQLLYPDTYKLAGRLLIYLNIKSSPKTMLNYIQILDSVLNEDFKKFVRANHEHLDRLLEETYKHNFDYDIMSASACINYLLRLSPDEAAVETPCQLYLRQAIQFYHNDGIDYVEICYREFLDKLYVHASPTMFNAGTKKNQMASCFLLTLGDNLESLLYTGVGDVGMISKAQGGIGLSMNAIRHSAISNTGTSSGVMPFGKIYDAAISCVDQGGKRNGAMTITLIDWHIDFFDFIQARDNFTQNGIRFKQANISAYLSSEFMRRVREDKEWTMFCPSRAVMEIDGREVKLLGKHSYEFDSLYHMFEEEAIKRDADYEVLDKRVQEMERIVNSGCDDATLLRYHETVSERTHARKKLIVHKRMSARTIYNKICDMHIKSSMPYIVYRDTVNYKNNMKNIGTVEGLNLCVAPETLVLTDKGHQTISELKDQTVNVWNGKEFSEVVVRQTASNANLLKVILSDGSELECTPEHRFYIQTKYPSSKLKSDILTSQNVEMVEAKNLKPDMKIVKCSYPILDVGEDMKYPYTSGFFTGDGTYGKRNEETKQCSYKSAKDKRYCMRHICYEQEDDEPTEFCQGICYTDKPMVTLYGDKKKLINYLAVRTVGTEFEDRQTVQLDINVSDKFHVPMSNSLRSKLDWFAGYVDADGCIAKNGTNQSLQVSSTNKEFLIQVKLMLQTCGCNPKVAIASEDRVTELPDGKGGAKEYNCNKLFRLLLTSYDLQTLVRNGFRTFRLVINDDDVQRSASQFVKIKEVVETGRVDDTFCFTEHKRHAGVFNGVFTSQCLEITEPSTPDAIASCNLAHINLKRFVLKEKSDGRHIRECYDFDSLGQASRSIVRNLNKVIEYNRYPLDEFDESGNVIKRGKISTPNFDNRPLGIGVSGLAEVFANLGIYYDSEEAIRLNKMIFACIYYNSILESCRLALVKDESYKNFDQGRFDAFVNGNWYSYVGSPMYNGMFQFDMWKQEADYLRSIGSLNEKLYDSSDDIPIEPNEWGQIGSWGSLREKISEYGITNSMFLAPMPTASSAQMLNNAETTEAHQTLMYSRKLAHGNYTAFSEPFIKDMTKYRLWNQPTIDFIMMCNGSIKHLDKFILAHQHLYPEHYFIDGQFSPEFEGLLNHLKLKHRGMYEISQKVCLKMARQRGIYIDQSQSLNIYLPEPNMRQLKAVHDYSESLRLKTGMYYLRANPSSQTDRFTVSIEVQEFYRSLFGEEEKQVEASEEAPKPKRQVVCTDEVCIMCQ